MIVQYNRTNFFLNSFWIKKTNDTGLSSHFPNITTKVLKKTNIVVGNPTLQQIDGNVE